MDWTTVANIAFTVGAALSVVVALYWWRRLAVRRMRNLTPEQQAEVERTVWTIRSRILRW
jgi:hypothetical protein